MPQDGDPRYEESFTSFLAGVLYTRKTISNLEFFELINRFEMMYNLNIISGDDMILPIYLDDNGIHLHKSYDEIIMVNKKSVTVKEYLYSSTTFRVREFLGIPEVNVKVDNNFVKKLFRKKVAV